MQTALTKAPPGSTVISHWKHPPSPQSGPSWSSTPAVRLLNQKGLFTAPTLRTFGCPWSETPERDKHPLPVLATPPNQRLMPAGSGDAVGWRVRFPASEEGLHVLLEPVLASRFSFETWRSYSLVVTFGHPGITLQLITPCPGCEFMKAGPVHQVYATNRIRKMESYCVKG